LEAIAAKSGALGAGMQRLAVPLVVSPGKESAMDQVFYLLAILGCGDDTLDCRQARIEPARYTSHASCQEAMADALRRNADLDFPVIAGICRRQTPETARQAAPRTDGRGR
jgi:hypothetical protein